MFQYSMHFDIDTPLTRTVALVVALMLSAYILPQQVSAYSKKEKGAHFLDSLRRADSLALLKRVPAEDTVKITLRTLEAVQMDSVEGLMLLADAHWSVKNYDKAGLFIRAAFAQYSKITPNGDDFPAARYDSLYNKLVSRYREFLAVQPELPPETPLDVLLEEDTEHLVVPPKVRTRVDSLFKVTQNEATKIKSVFDKYQKRQPSTTPITQPILPPVPVVTNRRVENAITFFITRGSGIYQKWMERSGRMMPVLMPILREEGIPEELFCLAMIESGLNPNALSRAKAAGIYQFINSTGNLYGLQTGGWYDERRNPEKATRAACRYLRKLYEDFGDWYLAIAAYNCGEGRISRTIRRERTEDYWRMKRLPRETRNYVPTYLATLLIFQEPERWGFTAPVWESPWRSDSVRIDGVVDLAVASKILGIPTDELKWRNPELVQFCTDPIDSCSILNVPRGMGKMLKDSLAKLSEDRKIRWVDHVVRKGESLRSISRKYGIPEKAIAELPWNSNGIRRKKNVVVGATIRFPTPVEQPTDQASL